MYKQQHDARYYFQAHTTRVCTQHQNRHRYQNAATPVVSAVSAEPSQPVSKSASAGTPTSFLFDLPFLLWGVVAQICYVFFAEFSGPFAPGSWSTFEKTAEIEDSEKPALLKHLRHSRSTSDSEKMSQSRDCDAPAPFSNHQPPHDTYQSAVDTQEASWNDLVAQAREAVARENAQSPDPRNDLMARLHREREARRAAELQQYHLQAEIDRMIADRLARKTERDRMYDQARRAEEKAHLAEKRAARAEKEAKLAASRARMEEAWAQRQRREAEATRRAQRQKEEAEAHRKQEEEARRKQEAEARRKQEAETRRKQEAEAAHQEAIFNQQLTFYYNSYDMKWNEVKAATGTGYIVTFAEFPWPSLRPLADPHSLTPQIVQEFISHEMWPNQKGKSLKERIRSEKLRWHPDKFKQQVTNKIVGPEMDIIIEGAALVIRYLNSWSESL